MLGVALCDQVPPSARIVMCARVNSARKDRSNGPDNKFFLFSADKVLGWRVVRLVSSERAVGNLASGIWRNVNDGLGKHIGYQIVGSNSDLDLTSHPTPAAISAYEMERVAGQSFEDGKSQTSGMTEDQRLTRINKETKRRLPPEDAVERTAAKVRVWPDITSAKGDILRVWPRWVK
jgi:hypothetical protein